ncbi:MAG: ABC transporter permease [Planctomycetota bacterium]|nr:ABC transporter permease [Planctomycetota bacterium]
MRYSFKGFINRFSTVIVLVLLIVVCYGVAGDRFIRQANLVNIARQISVVTILSFAQTLIIITGQIDLSIGAVAGMAGTFSCAVYVATQNLFLAVLTALVIGAVVGLINGLVITRFSVPSFIVTLAMQSIAMGIIFLHTKGNNIYNIGDYKILGQGNFLYFPIPVWFMIAFWLVIAFVLKFCKFGRYLYATGGNEYAAIASGISTKNVKLLTFIISGLMASFAGVILMARLNAGIPIEGIGYETDAIMATIVGGTSFTGGTGTATGTLIGSFIIGILNNILNLMGVQSYVQQIVKGSLIILAVILDVYSKSRKRTVTIMDTTSTVAADDGGP